MKKPEMVQQQPVQPNSMDHNNNNNNSQPPPNGGGGKDVTFEIGAPPNKEDDIYLELPGPLFNDKIMNTYLKTFCRHFF